MIRYSVRNHAAAIEPHEALPSATGIALERVASGAIGALPKYRDGF